VSVTFSVSGGEKPDGQRIHRRIVFGSAENLKALASARKMVVGMRHEINMNDIRTRRESITLADLCRHNQQRELAGRKAVFFSSTGASVPSRLRTAIILSAHSH
jgi:hypothetical protein